MAVFNDHIGAFMAVNPLPLAPIGAPPATRLPAKLRSVIVPV